MTPEEIIAFLKENIEPIEDSIYGSAYRTSAYLTDGTLLPCVTFRRSDKLVDQAIKRFTEEESISATNFGYYNTVKSFVTTGNCINYYDIAKIEVSKYAFPVNILKQIKGETTMGWTGFVARMKDNKLHSFGTGFNFEYFNMPEGYTSSDIVEIINHSYIDKYGELKSHRSPDIHNTYSKEIVFRSKPFFECYIDDL